ncbi:aminopeptidase [Patescibacteria group bacterium]|nr:aminopeptidase [Patescibacteria group bacterium]
MGTIKQGAYNAINVALKVKSGEKVIIISEKPTSEVGEALRDEVGKITDNVVFVVMEDLGKRPVGWNDELEKEYEDADVSIYAAGGVGKEIVTFRMPMLRAVHANFKIRHAHMIGIEPKIMEQGMCTDFVKVKQVGDWLYQKVRDAREIKVATPAGTDLTVEFTPSFKWVLSDANIVPGREQNLPPGEVFTVPYNVKGTMVIDGCLGDFFAKKYKDIKSTPITLQIERGRAVKDSIECENNELKEEYANYLFDQEENSNRVGEFAFGINVELTGFIGNLLQDEKFPGVHLGFGATSKAQTGADWDCDTHVDGVMRDATAWVDGEMVMEKGKFVLQR